MTDLQILRRYLGTGRAHEQLYALSVLGQCRRVLLDRRLPDSDAILECRRSFTHKLHESDWPSERMRARWRAFKESRHAFDMGAHEARVCASHLLYLLDDLRAWLVANAPTRAEQAAARRATRARVLEFYRARGQDQHAEEN
jgi:hypothetical protein